MEEFQQSWRTGGGRISKGRCERATGSQLSKIRRLGNGGTGELGGCPSLVDKLSKAESGTGMVLKVKNGSEFG